MSDYVAILKPLEEATTNAGADSYPTLSAQIPILYCILACLNSSISQQTITSSFSSNLAKCLKTRFPDFKFDQVASLAMLLDPRFKAVVYEEDRSMGNWLKNLGVEEAQKIPETQRSAGVSSEIAAHEVPSRSALWQNLDSLIKQKQHSMTQAEEEVAGYLHEDVLAREEDPCKWWCEKGATRYPLLALLDPAAEPPSEAPPPVAEEEEECPSSASSSSQWEGQGGVTLEEFIGQLQVKGRKGLYQEYSQLKARGPQGTFLTARLKANQCKNRYTDVLCYDHSRVTLARRGDDEDSTYINANFVDGYRHKNAFISTQGPLPKTYCDFWRMVWEQRCAVIVMTTRTFERGRGKCGQYWPAAVKASMDFDGLFRVTTLSADPKPDYIQAELELHNYETKETRLVSHLQFTSWPDYGVPDSALAMLAFRGVVRDKQAQALASMEPKWEGHPLGPPIVVHCSAGIGRTGTFITLDICILQLEEEGRVDVRSTVERIRSQRAFSIQMPDQYVFCHLALLEFALLRGLLQDVALDGFEDDDDRGGSDSE
ncbi:tyrosine-protein phosphatase non-receptor type 9 [Ixodes scapularis]|uniref:tyrosine-protein phosphatase non-receptor type 9 n=1 Tax=Ixodes scapularis TaxID=6945 RepID=UPI001A9F2CE0|nr:tyrosine-protein phosphatase non-receptor type 9 [Ixodes scapularis]